MFFEINVLTMINKLIVQFVAIPAKNEGINKVASQDIIYPVLEYLRARRVRPSCSQNSKSRFYPT